MRTYPFSFSSLLLASSALLAACSSQSQSTPAEAPTGAPSPAADTATPPPGASSAAQAPSAAPEHAKEAPHWKYEGEAGPAHWGELSSEFEKCKSGQEQSPIDLPQKGDKAAKAAKLVTSYAKLPLQIVNNGHTVQVAGSSGGKISIDGVDYALAQFHMHAPSEHTVAGKAFDMEVHLVHKNASGELAVIGLLLTKGKENKALAPVFQAAPKEESKEPQAIANATVDIPALIPAKAAYYNYAGSLTTPPCSEGVKWFVLVKPLEVSEVQIKQFRSVMHGDTARPTLPLGSRKISEGQL